MTLSAEHVASVRGSTTTDAAEVAAFLDRALKAAQGRGGSIAQRNRERTEAEHAALDAAVRQVIGAAPLVAAHGVPCVIQQRIHTAVKVGKLSSTLGGTDEPSIRVLRLSIKRINIAAPVLGRHPEPFSSTYSSAST